MAGRLRPVHGPESRIEIPKDRFNEFLSDNELIDNIKKIGFRYITLDMEGFRSGSMD